MPKLTPEREAAYALDYGENRSDLTPAAQAEYHRLLEEHPARLLAGEPTPEAPAEETVPARFDAPSCLLACRPRRSHLRSRLRRRLAVRPLTCGKALGTNCLDRRWTTNRLASRLSAWESDRSRPLADLTWTSGAPLVTIMDP